MTGGTRIRGLAMACRVLSANGLLATGLLLVLITTPALAGDGWVDELELGILDHSASFISSSVESGVDINGEVRFHQIDWFTDQASPDWAKLILDPRPTLGASINTSGGTSAEYFGLTWGVTYANNLFKPNDSVFGELGFGGAFQDGRVGPGGDPNQIDFSTRALFHLSADLGYRFDPHIGLSVYFEHYSNGGLARPNPGLNNIGLRLGYRF